MTDRPLRVSFLAGTLGLGGAEKQLLYMVDSLRGPSVELQLLSLTEGEYYSGRATELGCPPTWIGQNPDPVRRLSAVVRALKPFRPDIVHSAHFYANLYCAVGAIASGALGVGSIRNDAVIEVAANGWWGRPLLLGPRGLVANSRTGKANAIALGRAATGIAVVPNVIDLEAFDAAAGPPPSPVRSEVVAGCVCRLVRAKRVDRFLRMLAEVRRSITRLRGIVVGDGPERAQLERIADGLGLLSSGAVTFLGRRDDVPRLLRSIDVLCLTSDHEGFPNVLLEGMAAALPTIATNAGDAGHVVEHGSTGYVVPPEDEPGLVHWLAKVAADADLRRVLGRRGRRRVETEFARSALAGSLLAAYASLASFGRREELAARLARLIEEREAP